MLGQQYENLSHVQLTSKASKCHPQLVTVNRPLLKKECIPGFHSAINVAAFQWNWNKINSVPKSISSNAFNWIHAIIHIIKKKLLFHVAWSSLAVNSCQHVHNYFTSCHLKQSGSDDRCMHLHLQLLVHQHHLHWSSSAIIIKRGNNSSTTVAPPGPTTCHARLKVANQKPP